MGLKCNPLFDARTTTVSSPSEAACDFGGTAHCISKCDRYRAGTVTCEPKRHARSSESMKPTPKTCTGVPPPGAPDEGITECTTVSATNSNCSVEHSGLPCGTPSSSSTRNVVMPLGLAGVRHSSFDVSATSARVVASPNTHTHGEPTLKPSPVTTTVSPPATLERAGLAEVSCTRWTNMNVVPADAWASLVKFSPLLLTRIVWVEGRWTGDVHTTSVVLIHCTDAAGVSPNIQAKSLDSKKLEPCTNTAVPPSSEPLDGETPVMMTASWNVNCWALPTVGAPSYVTATDTTPAACAGELHVAVVLDSTRASTGVLWSPNEHARPCAKPLPSRVTTVLPLVGPDLGWTESTTTLGRKVNSTPSFTKSTPLNDSDTRTGPGPRIGTGQ